MSEEVEEISENIRRLAKKDDDLKNRRRGVKKLEALLPFLKQGHGSGLNADMVDDLHATQIIKKAVDKAKREIPGGGPTAAAPGGGDMLKAVYDVDEDDIVDNSEKLEGSTKSQVQDHTPKAHTLDSHSEKKLDQLDEKTPAAGVTVDNCLIKDGKVADSNKLEASTKAEVQDHTPKAHTLASHSTKSHLELEGVTASQHHAKTIDNEVFGLLKYGTFAARPSPGTQYRFYYATDTKQLFIESGAAWGEIARGESAIRLAQLAEKLLNSLSDVNLSSPSEGQMLIYNATAGEWQNADPLVTVNREGTPTRVNVTASGQIVAAPGSGKKLILCGFVLTAYADETFELRWNGASGPIIAACPTKGIIAMNLLGIAEESGQNQNLYLTKSGSGNVRGTVWTKEVST